jgi:hypothetical protein
MRALQLMQRARPTGSVCKSSLESSRADGYDRTRGHVAPTLTQATGCPLSGVSEAVCPWTSGARLPNTLGDPLALGGWNLGTPRRVQFAGVISRRLNPTVGSIWQRLTIDCQFRTVRVEGQHRSHFGGLSRRRLVAPYDAVVRLSVDVERPI